MPAPPPSFSAEVLLDALEAFAEAFFVSFLALPPAVGVVAFVSTGDDTVTLAKKPGENGFLTQAPAPVGTAISAVASVVAAVAQAASLKLATVTLQLPSAYSADAVTLTDLRSVTAVAPAPFKSTHSLPLVKARALSKSAGTSAVKVLAESLSLHFVVLYDSKAATQTGPFDLAALAASKASHGSLRGFFA